MKKTIHIAALIGVVALGACGGESAPERIVSAAGASASVPDNDLPVIIQCADSFASYRAKGSWFLNETSGASGNIDPQLAVDGDFNTFTTAAWLDQDGVEVMFSVRPQIGVAFPAGVTPGFWMAREQANNGLFVRSVKTLLDGEIQDEFVSNELNGNQFNLGLAPSYFGVAATKPFDELVVAYSGGARLSDMRIFEACVDQ